MQNRSHIGERLRDERNSLKLSQVDLATALGVSRRSVIDWEKGAATPNAEVLAALADLGCDVLYVLIGTRSIGRPGMTKEEVEQFNDLVNLFWSTSEESRKAALNMLSALHLRDVQDGSARGVRKKT